MRLLQRIHSFLPATIFLLFFTMPVYSNSLSPSNPIEAGDVHWGRDLPTALDKSKLSGKPVFLLFQEIPGCIGCKQFGKNVLKHALLVEAIESLFIPVLVYNNRPGTNDETILKRYNEPSWNYQVIRFLNESGEDIIPRKDRVWSIGLLAHRMVKVLEKMSLPVPLYLRSVEHLHRDKSHNIAAFAMACFWTGEYKLGRINGVITTEAGWYDNREVTMVIYDRNTLKLNDLVNTASKEKCAQRVYLPKGETVNRSFFDSKVLHLSKYQKASMNHQKKQLTNNPEIHNIPNLNSMQLTKINSLLPDNYIAAMKWISPHQASFLLKKTIITFLISINTRA